MQDRTLHQFVNASDVPEERRISTSGAYIYADCNS